MLDDGKDLGMPDGVLMNGKGPYRYNATLVPDGIDHETINVEPGDHPLFASTETLESNYVLASFDSSHYLPDHKLQILRFTE